MTLQVGDWVLLPDGRIQHICEVEGNECYRFTGQENRWRGDEGLRLIDKMHLEHYLDLDDRFRKEIFDIQAEISDLRSSIQDKHQTHAAEMSALYTKLQEEKEWAETTHNGQWEEKPVVRGTDSIGWLFPLLANRGYIGGSYAAFCVSPLTCPILPNDLDIFCLSVAAQKDLRGELEGHGYQVRGITAVAITLESPDLANPTIQIVAPHPQWKEFPRDILNSFDLNVCRAILLSETTALADKEAGMKRGRILRLNDPLRTLARVVKYQARGVKFDNHELLKLFRAWSDLPKAKQEEQIEQARREANPYSSPSQEDYTWDEEDDYWEGEGAVGEIFTDDDED